MISAVSNTKTKVGNHVSFKGKASAWDLGYKKMLIEGIQDSFQFTPKIEDLNSIVGPSELKSLLMKFKKNDFLTGLREFGKITSPREFENIKNGNFRVNLHLHTNKSDGTMSPMEYLEMSKKYADKVARTNPDKSIPPYTSTTTDHNNIEAAKEIIAAIAEEPKKYKNFKFTTGCEFMFLDENSPFKYKAFEAIGLGFNPFDAELNQKLSRMNSLDLISVAKKDGAIASYAHPYKALQGNGVEPEFVNYLKDNGIDAIEANYQYLSFCNDKSIKSTIRQAHEVADSHNLFITGGTDSHGKNIFFQRAQYIIDDLLG